MRNLVDINKPGEFMKKIYKNFINYIDVFNDYLFQDFLRNNVSINADTDADTDIDADAINLNLD